MARADGSSRGESEAASGVARQFMGNPEALSRRGVGQSGRPTFGLPCMVMERGWDVLFAVGHGGRKDEGDRCAVDHDGSKMFASTEDTRNRQELLPSPYPGFESIVNHSDHLPSVDRALNFARKPASSFHHGPTKAIASSFKFRLHHFHSIDYKPRPIHYIVSYIIFILF
jgi:hypothetical protein